MITFLRKAPSSRLRSIVTTVTFVTTVTITGGATNCHCRYTFLRRGEERLDLHRRRAARSPRCAAPRIARDRKRPAAGMDATRRYFAGGAGDHHPRRGQALLPASRRGLARDFGRSARYAAVLASARGIDHFDAGRRASGRRAAAVPTEAYGVAEMGPDRRRAGSGAHLEQAADPRGLPQPFDFPR